MIDWEGARIGPRDADVAITWMLLEIAELDRRAVVPATDRRLSSAVDCVQRSWPGFRQPSAATIRAVCEYRLTRDRNMRPVEQERIRQFVAEHG